MPKTSLLFICVIILAVLSGCASKKYAKKAQKMDQAGMYADAAQLYYQSLAANRNNLDARIGLQRNGQLLLNSKVERFNGYYNANAVKDAVYSWLDVENYYRQVEHVGVILQFPTQQLPRYEDVKNRYLNSRYADGIQAMQIEDFINGEIIFGEIINIEPTFKDSQDQWTTAKYEPMYRQANDYYANGLYRSSWMLFNTIVVQTNGYKDALARREEALAKAQITIAVAPFFYSHQSDANFAQNLRSRTIANINQLSTPFYKVIPDNIITNLPFMGIGGQLAIFAPWIIKQSRSIKAQTVLAVQITRFKEIVGDQKVFPQTGYLKVNEEYTDANGIKKTRIRYDKVRYDEVELRNATVVQANYALIDVKTGNMLVSNSADITLEDHVVFAAYPGDVKRLVPGYWKSKDRTYPEDAVYDTNEQVSKLNALLNARRELKPVQNLTNDAMMQVATYISSDIERYNPEL